MKKLRTECLLFNSSRDKSEQTSHRLYWGVSTNQASHTITEANRQVAFAFVDLLRRHHVFLERDVQGRAVHLPGLLRRLGPRRHGLPALQLHHPLADRRLAPD